MLSARVHYVLSHVLKRPQSHQNHLERSGQSFEVVSSLIIWVSVVIIASVVRLLYILSEFALISGGVFVF